MAAREVEHQRGRDGSTAGADEFDNTRKQIRVSAHGSVSGSIDASTTAPTSKGKITAPQAIRSALAQRPLQPDALTRALTAYGIEPDNQRKAMARGMGKDWAINAAGAIALLPAAVAAA